MSEGGREGRREGGRESRCVCEYLQLEYGVIVTSSLGC